MKKNNKLIILLGGITLILMFGFLKNLMGSSTDQATLSQAIADQAYLVDVRTPAEFASGSVKGAVNIPLNTITQKSGSLKGKKNIVVFCRSGNRSAQAQSLLEQQGITQVHNGGTWQNVQKIVNEHQNTK